MLHQNRKSHDEQKTPRQRDPREHELSPDMDFPDPPPEKGGQDPTVKTTP